MTQTFDVVVSQEYVTLTKCQSCHSRLVLLGRHSRIACPLFTPCVEISIPERRTCQTCSTRSSNMSAHIRHHRTWQLDRVRASCLTTRSCAKSDVRYVSCTCIAWAVNPRVAAHNPRCSSFALSCLEVDAASPRLLRSEGLPLHLIIKKAVLTGEPQRWLVLREDCAVTAVHEDAQF